MKLAMTKIPNEMLDLFTSINNEVKKFKKYVRLYKTIFAFTSFGVNLDKDLTSSRRGVYTFRVQG